MSCSVFALPAEYPVLTTLTTIIVIAFTAFYLFLKKQYQYWKKHGVAGPEPQMFVGNVGELVLLKKTEPEILAKYYKEYSHEKYIGTYSLWQPVLLIRDHELAKRIFENDFEHFTDHPHLRGHVRSDQIVDSLFTMRGDIWKARRAVFMKMFTPKKLKQYFDDMQYSLTLFFNATDKKINEDIEISSLLDRHFVRVICSMLYGLDVSKDDKRIDKFIEGSDIFSNPPWPTALKFLFYMVEPTLFRFLNVRVYPLSFWEYFLDFTDEVFNAKKKVKDIKNDLLEIVINLTEEDVFEDGKITFDEAVGHLYSFFQGSHHTSQVTAGHALLLLARHPELQERLRHEIDSVTKGSEITYEHILQMPLLEAVTLETLRMFPLLGVIKRRCTKTYKLDDKVTVPEGMIILIPVQSFHMDPEIYPEPEKFSPDRFLEKDDRSGTFLSFGKGPRVCIGKKLGMLSVELILARILSKYVVLPSKKQVRPLKFSVTSLFITVRPECGFWIKLQKRDNIKMVN